MPSLRLPALKPTKYSQIAKLLFLIAAVEVLAIIGIVAWINWPKETHTPDTSTGQTPPPSNSPDNRAPIVAFQKVVDGLDKPTTITTMGDGGDGRLFVTEQDGTIQVISAGAVESAPFLDITSKVRSRGEMGLLGLAFHPRQDLRPYIYLNYVDKQQNTVIARYTISAATGRADSQSEKVLIKLRQPYQNHNGGELVFGPDGYLYIGLGDGGSGGDPQNRAQDKDELLGKILRVDVDSGDPYAIPGSNPFSSGGGKPEVWAYGLRNPWRLSFDRQTGDLFIADVGQNAYEELNFQPAASRGGENYGWRCLEGTHTFNATGNCLSPTGLAAPILEYDHSQDRCSITGGFVYRGSKYPALTGKYFYGDYCSGHVYYAQLVEGVWQTTEVADTDFAISTFGQDARGELYLADHNTGSIYHIVDTAN